jgi:hypothetical protein
MSMDEEQSTHLALKVLAWSAFIAVAGFIILMLVWALYPYQTLKVWDVKVLNPVVQQGSTLVFTQKYNKETNAPGTVTRHFVDGISFDAGTTPADAKAGSGVSMKAIPVPTTLPAGKYHIRTIVTFKVNPIREITYEYRTPSFLVTSATGHPDYQEDLDMRESVITTP